MNEDSLRNLLKQVSLINDKYGAIAKITGENFNIFNILGVRSDELSHSSFIAELLNPKGCHEKEDIFLKLFFEEINKTYSDNPIKFEATNISITKENSIGKKNEEETEGGRIDIEITDKNQNKIIIENKVYAKDQKNQLLRYHNYDVTAKIIYLNLFADPPKILDDKLVVGTNLFIISYKEHIVKWLQACLPNAVSNPILRETIVQYINIVKDLTNQLNNKQMEQNISEVILSSKESLIAAESVFKSFEAAKCGLLDEFWDEVNSVLIEKCSYKNTWFHPSSKSSFALGIKTDLPNTFFFIEPLNGKHYKPRFNDLFIGLYSENILKDIDHSGPIDKFRNTKKMGYNFDSYETIEKILPTNKESRNFVINDIVNQAIDYIKSPKTQELLNQFK